MKRRTFLHLAAGAAALPAVSRVAIAQAYPLRPITIIAPFPAGGPVDIVARVIGETMSVSLGQPITVENIAGAGGSIGVGRAARAAPDGYTLVLGNWNTHLVNGAIYSLPYDVVDDFMPISLIADTPTLIVGRKTLPVDDVKSLIIWLKANEAKASAGTAGIGTPQHLIAVFFQNATNTRFQLIPYRGGAPALQDLVANQIDLIFGNAPIDTLPFVREGKIKPYAVTAERRIAIAPEIPTAVEAGLRDFHFKVWFGLFAPKGTPPSTVNKLNTAIVETLASTNVRTRFAELGLDVFPREQQTPSALAVLQKAEIDKWWPIIKAAGIKAE
jgi:tripartite-type tricarboxylate transporter receptor subunit TctC